jgi:outer membrane biosynthesis protein TonB
VWPKLAGRTAAQFVIAPDGSVSIVHTAESSFDNPALECCINTAIRSWQFDRPAGGGVVVVTYPFILEQVD